MGLLGVSAVADARVALPQPPNRAGDGGAVHAVPHREGLVRHCQPQPGQGDQQPVAQGQGWRVSGAGPAVTVPLATSAVQPTFPRRAERCCQFGDKSVQVVAGDAGEDRMGQGRTGLLDRHKSETVRPVTVLIKPDTPGRINTPQLVPRSLAWVVLERSRTSDHSASTDFC